MFGLKKDYLWKMDWVLLKSCLSHCPRGLWLLQHWNRGFESTRGIVCPSYWCCVIGIGLHLVQGVWV